MKIFLFALFFLFSVQCFSQSNMYYNAQKDTLGNYYIVQESKIESLTGIHMFQFRSKPLMKEEALNMVLYLDSQVKRQQGEISAMFEAIKNDPPIKKD